MLYDICKFVHITGVVMLMGNITATAIWKFFADRTGDARIIGFAQKLVTYTDWSLTVWGIVLIVGGGYGALYVGNIAPFGEAWLVWSQILFVIAGMIWLGLLVPLQMRQARAAKAFADSDGVPEAYRRDSRRWMVWGLVSTVPLVAATWLMVAKPF